MTLPEFLLARIAEDEAELGVLQTHDESAGANGIGWSEVGAISEVLMISHARALAECAAKRGILGLHWFMEFTVRVQTNEQGVQSPIEPGSFEDIVSQRGSCMACSGLDIPCQTLRAIGAVYADHPDYEQEWKP